MKSEEVKKYLSSIWRTPKTDEIDDTKPILVFLETGDIYKCRNAFPELVESEDDKTRKELISFLQLPHPQFVGERKQEKWLAWLEKQQAMNPEEMRDLLRMEYSKGRYDTITKAVEWLYQRQAVDLEVSNIEKFINDFKKDMEEQQ